MAERFNPAKYRDAYQKEKYSRIFLRLRVEDKDLLEQVARSSGKSINRFISDLIAQAIPGISPLGAEKEKAIQMDEADPAARKIIEKKVGDRLADPEGVTVTEFAQSISMGRNLVFDALRGGGYLQSSDSERNMPAEKAADLIAVRQTLLTNEKGSYRVCRTPIITPKGQEFFRQYFQS